MLDFELTSTKLVTTTEDISLCVCGLHLVLLWKLHRRNFVLLMIFDDERFHSSFQQKILYQIFILHINKSSRSKLEDQVI